MVAVTPTEYGVIEDVLHARYPSVYGSLRDELVSAGHEGLARAARQYDNDHQHGKSFRNYSWALVRFAMQDTLRQHDHLTRGHRGRVREGLEEDPGAPVPLNTGHLNTVADPADAYTDLENRLAAAPLVVHAMSTLTFRERIIIESYDLHGWTQTQVGDLLGVTPTRVSQIRAGALRRMRESLNEYREAA